MNALLDWLLGSRCGICGERVRVPLEAHQMFNHAGDPR